MKKDIDLTAQILCKQSANIVFTYNIFTKNYVFRRGDIDLNIPTKIIKLFKIKLLQENNKEFLISYNNLSKKQFISLLFDIKLNHNKSLKQLFHKYKINLYYKFNKCIFIANYGSLNTTLSKDIFIIKPHIGIRKLAYFIIRNEKKTDVRVFNPNLAIKERLYNIVSQENINYFAYSYLGSTIKFDLEIISKLKTLSPKSIFIAGGNELNLIPINKLIKSIPIDIFVLDKNENTLKNIFKKDAKTNIKNIYEIPNLIINHNNQIHYTKSKLKKNSDLTNPKIYKDTPILKKDITHNKKFPSIENFNKLKKPEEINGKKTMRLRYSNNCDGNCIFCMSPRKNQPITGINYFIKSMKTNYHLFDSFRIDDNNFLWDIKAVKSICNKIIQQKLHTKPKRCKARPDDLSKEIIQLLKEAGFSIIAIGVETFDEKINKKLGKKISKYKIKQSLDILLQKNITPYIFLMLFSPWETKNSLKDTIENTIQYIEKGAYVSISTKICLGFGIPMSNMNSIVKHQNIYYKGMKTNLFYPSEAKIINKKMQLLREKAYKDFKKKRDNSAQLFIDSHTYLALLFFKSIYISINETKEKIQQINSLIEQIKFQYIFENFNYSNINKKNKQLINNAIKKTIFDKRDFNFFSNFINKNHINNKFIRKKLIKDFVYLKLKSKHDYHLHFSGSIPLKFLRKYCRNNEKHINWKQIAYLPKKYNNKARFPNLKKKSNNYIEALKKIILDKKNNDNNYLQLNQTFKYQGNTNNTRDCLLFSTFDLFMTLCKNIPNKKVRKNFIKKATKALLKELVQDNVTKADLRIQVIEDWYNKKNNYTLDSLMLTTIIKEIEIFSKKNNIEISIYLTINRDFYSKIKSKHTFDNEEYLKIYLYKHITKKIINLKSNYLSYIKGFDIVGNESKLNNYDIEKSIDFLFNFFFLIENKLNKKLQIFAHIGEDFNKTNIKKLFNLTKYIINKKINRLSHCIHLGINFHNDLNYQTNQNNIIKNIKELNIPIETCVFSNLVSNKFSSIHNHSYINLEKKGVDIIFGTDDKNITNMRLTWELFSIKNKNLINEKKKI